ncbi:MAG: DUF4097 family beta strand repeat-containing protein [Thermoplasmatota archaeon]
MKPRWKAFGILSGLLIGSVLLLTAYMASMGYFELDTIEVVETHVFEGDLELSVNNDFGLVEVKTWERTNVEIVGIKKTLFGEEELEKIGFVVEKTDGFKVTGKRDGGATWVWMDLKIKIPRTMNVSSLSSENGRIEASGIRGDFDVRVENGEIDMENIEGNISLKSTNGRINLKESHGNFTLETENGDIYTTNVENILSAETENGWVHIYESAWVGSASSENGEVWVKRTTHLDKAETENGEVIVQVYDVPVSGMRLRTSNGRVDVTIPETLAVNYTIDVRNGDIRFRGFDDDSREGSENYGHLNGGGPQIDIEVVNGDVYLRGE